MFIPSLYSPSILSAPLFLTLYTHMLTCTYNYQELLVRGLGAGMAGAAAARRHLSTEMTLPTHEFLSYNYLGPGSASSGGAPLTPGATPAETQSQADAYGGSDELVLSTREVRRCKRFIGTSYILIFTMLLIFAAEVCDFVLRGHGDPRVHSPIHVRGQVRCQSMRCYNDMTFVAYLVCALNIYIFRDLRPISPCHDRPGRARSSSRRRHAP
jgi:hypothetical protein